MNQQEKQEAIDNFIKITKTTQKKAFEILEMTFYDVNKVFIN